MTQDGTERSDQRPRVWVGCLACYNEGRLIGEWFRAIDVPQDMGDFDRALIDRSQPERSWHDCAAAGIHEELWCFDHDGFSGLLVGECSPAEAARLARLIDEVIGDGYAIAAYAGYSAGTGPEFATVDEFRDVYCGKYDTEADYAQQLADDLGILTTTADGDLGWPISCIDWHRAWRELEYGGDNYSTPAPDGAVYIFRSA